ncbi:response regulator [Niabella ginsenosidivorans]|nr:response regulator [Niabella ginsenosidivorans]
MIILVGLGIYANTYTFRYKQSMKSTTEKGILIGKAEQILFEVQELQNNLRGYLVTSDPSYLNSFKVAERMVRLNLLQIKPLALSQDQMGQFTEISSLVEQEISLAKNIIAIQADTTSAAKANVLSANKDEHYLSANIKSKLLALISDQRAKQNIDLALEKRNSNFDKVVFVITLSILVSVTILLLLLFYILKTYKRLTSTEKLLLQSQLRLENILDMLPIGIFIVNALNREYHANHKATELLDSGLAADGYLAEEVEHTTEKDRLGKDLMETLLISKALNGEHHIGINRLILKKDNSELPLRVSATPLYNDNNQIEYAISVFDDITSIKNVENELIEAKKLVEQSLRLKESFLTNMSHEIRTPMNAILGFTELLARKDLGPQQNEYVRTIQSSSDNLLRLLNDILDFSKLEADMLVFEEQPISINDIVVSICDLLMPKAVSKGISLSYLCDPSIPKVVTGDSVRLNQVITNIVGNAIKFTDQGSVSILVKFLKADQDRTFIEFTVKDTGIGIAADKIASVFNRFEQADTETSRHYGGTGLGLSIAKHIIESQKGTINVASQPGVGTTFTFVIPFKFFNETDGKIDKVEERLPIDEHFMHSVKVLLVEDNLFNRKLMQGIFKEYYLTIDMAENGKSALERLLSVDYDVILMDIEMPEMNGYETSRIIRNELKLNTPIIALTAHAMAGEREKCLQAGMNDYLTKPVNVNQLFEKIYSIMRFGETDPAANEKNRMPEQKEAPATEGGTPGFNNAVDLSYLREISSGNKEFEKEMIELLLAEIPEQIESLTTAVAAEDFQEIKIYAHKLKSLVPIVGAPDTAPFFSDLEDKAVKKVLDKEDTALFYRIMTRLNTCINQLKQMLENEYA